MSKSVLDVISKIAQLDGERIAIKSCSEELSYKELWQKSDALADWLNLKLKDNNKPVMVYGHKSPQMIVCFLACAKSGRAYCPVDISMPLSRIREIADTIDNKIILATETFESEKYEVIGKDAIELICRKNETVNPAGYVDEKDVYYIIFTSGSTGKPKGVEITAENLYNFTKWSTELLSKDCRIFLNQAPFSFDLSVMDLYTCLCSGGTLVCLTKELQQDMGEMFDYLKESNIECWVSTPSFAEMCMADRSFDETLLKNLKTFAFCGERFTKEAAAKLMERFPKAKIINTYGPTESTVAVTSTEIDKKMVEEKELLPIGLPKDGTKLIIRDEELLIIGDTVGKGYFNDTKKTSEAFIETTDDEGKKVRAYKTGDKGYFDGEYYYCTGRKDAQIKLHGYRIELGDIEQNLMECCEVEQAVVLPKYGDEKIRSLVAFVTGNREGCTAKELKNKLKEKLPAYMIPKNIKFLDSMPMTANGKLDRKKLEAEFI